LKIHKIYIDREVADHSVTRTICERLNKPVEIVDSPDVVYRSIAASSDPETLGKRNLMLTRNRGSFLKACPGTAHYTCCNYHILHIGSYCPMDCSYCILQAYFHPPALQFFVNTDEMHSALDRLFSEETIYRIGTGEFTDSLVWEDIYPISRELIGRFAAQSSTVLELKTKTVAIDHLLDLPHERKTILSWSLNTPRVIREQERFTTSLSERISAAARCQARDYPLAFHFDPMVIYPGCRQEYAEVIGQLFSQISPDNIVWISMGSFRFIPSLKPIIERRFSNSKIVYGEFIKGIDGKMRYFKPLRINLYRAVVDAIRKHAPDVPLYFCMEDDEVWKKSIGLIPADIGGVPQFLDQSAMKQCGITGRIQSV